MTNIDWVQRVEDALKHLGEEFKTNELAYLALTSKVEKQVIDRLAFRLHRECGNDHIAIPREFTVPKKIQRVDLAIVENKMPRLFLEAKAMQSFNVNLPEEGRGYPAAIRKDKAKLKAYKPPKNHPNLDKVVLHLTTHTSSKPAKKWDGVVKYASRIRNYRPQSIDELKNKLDQQLPKKTFPVCTSGDIRGGCAFSMSVTIHFRLFGPY